MPAGRLCWTRRKAQLVPLADAAVGRRGWQRRDQQMPVSASRPGLRDMRRPPPIYISDLDTTPCLVRKGCRCGRVSVVKRSCREVLLWFFLLAVSWPSPNSCSSVCCSTSQHEGAHLTVVSLPRARAETLHIGARLCARCPVHVI